MKIAVGNWLRGAVMDNLGLKVLSLILACTVFLLVNTDEKREINAVVRIRYVLPVDKALVSEHVDEIKVTIRGPWRRIRRFDERQIERIDLDLTHVPGGEVAITPDMIHLPSGLEITSIQPNVIRVAFEDKIKKTVPVTATLAGRPLHGFQLVGTTLDRPTVAVRGATSVVNALDAVRTQEVRVDGRSDTFTTTVPLVPPEGVELTDRDTDAVVTVEVKPELVKQPLRIPLTVRMLPGATGAWVADPPDIDVVLTGELLEVERWIQNGVIASVTVPAGATGVLHPAVQIEGGPPQIGRSITPDTVTLKLKKSE